MEFLRSSVVTNSYYINSIESMNEYGAPLPEDIMKSEEFVDMLNTEEIVFVIDDDNQNNGYPIFATRSPLFSEENDVNSEISVYPNPAKDCIKLEFSDGSNCQSVEIYSIDGRLVETFPETSYPTTISIANLNAGIYIIKIKIADGREFAKRIVKE